jgi:hypothetical protein
MDRAEAGLRAQTGEKPTGGYYTSSERITLQKFSLGRITTLPRSVFGGRTVAGGGGDGAAAGGGGGGGAVAAGSAIVVRPQTSLVDRAQTLQIQTNAQSIGGLQQSLDVIRVQVTELNQGIQNTARQLQAESALEQNQLKQEQEAERRLAERKVRLGKESELEKNIQAALMRPIAKLQQTVTSLFDRIMGALTTLFFGWLTNQGIETLKALAEGDTKKLEEIKNNVIKNVLFAIGAFAAVNLGFGLLMRTITGLTLKLGSFVARIALAPFRLAGAAIGRLLGFGANAAKTIVRPGGRVPITTSGGKVLGAGSPMSRFLGGVKNIGKGAQSALKGVGSVASKILTPLAIGVGTYRISQGDIVGGLLSYGSAIPGVGLGFAGLDVAREFGFGKGTFFGKKEDQPAAATSAQPAAQPAATTSAQPAATTSAQPAAQPQTPAIPSMSEMTFGVDTANMLQGPAQSLTQETAPAAGTLNVEGLIQEKTPSADIQAPPKPNTPVGTLPEAKPNIIMAGGGKDRTQTMVSQQEPLTDVPFIPSSNTDNFYVLYSQLNYNVVM